MGWITLFETTKTVLRNRSALAIFAGLYALLLATAYGFIATREATVWQVLLTMVFVALMPAEFFIMQALIVGRGHGGQIRWGHALGDSCKLAIVSLPVIVVGVALFYWLNKWQARFPAQTSSVTLQRAAIPGPPKPTTPTPSQAALIFATLRGLIFWIALPLAAIHLWIEAASKDARDLLSGGASAVLKRTGRVIARAFAPQSVGTYAIGLILFALAPYAVLFIPVTVKGLHADFAVFIARLLLAFGFSLCGWLITLGALKGMIRNPAIRN